MGAALDASVTATRDLALGGGHRLTLRQHRITIELFPTAGAAQLTAPEAQLVVIVASPEPPRLVSDGVRFVHGARTLTLTPSGEVRLVVRLNDHAGVTEAS